MNWLLRGLLHHVYMDQANDGTTGGAAAGAEAAGQGEGGAGDNAQSGGGNQADQSGAGAEGNAADTNVLAGASGESTQAAQIQEKFLIKKEDGTVDWEKSAQKQAQSYEALEKRIGSNDAPPKSAEDYVINVPDNLKEALGDDFKEDPMLQGFLKDAHAAGMSQKQVDLAVGKYLEAIPALAGEVQKLSADDCTAELKQEWKTDAEFKSGVESAKRAAIGYFGNDAEQIIQKYGNDPALIRGLAKIGKEMGEDNSVNPESALGGSQTVDELMASEAYSNPKHADHAKVSKQVSNYFAALAKQQEKSGAVPLV